MTKCEKNYNLKANVSLYYPVDVSSIVSLEGFNIYERLAVNEKVSDLCVNIIYNGIGINRHTVYKIDAVFLYNGVVKKKTLYKNG